uniref:Uncharacterized protein n=1 Tax=Glossina palpalis gambiensis TaxID=67801 RepID=A0A1B0AWU7_9MUSC
MTTMMVMSSLSFNAFSFVNETLTWSSGLVKEVDTSNPTKNKKPLNVVKLQVLFQTLTRTMMLCNHHRHRQQLRLSSNIIQAKQKARRILRFKAVQMNNNRKCNGSRKFSKYQEMEYELEKIISTYYAAFTHINQFSLIFLFVSDREDRWHRLKHLIAH